MNKTKGIRNFLSFFTFLFSISPFIILGFFEKLFNLILPKQLGIFRYIICIIICIILYFMLSWYITTKMFIPTIIEVIGPILIIIGIFLMNLVPKKVLLSGIATFSGLILTILVPIILSLNFFTIGETYEDVARIGSPHFFRMTKTGKQKGLHVEGIGGAPDFLSNKKKNNLRRGQYIRVELQNGLLGIPLLIDHDTVPLSLEEVNEIRARSKATNNSSI